MIASCGTVYLRMQIKNQPRYVGSKHKLYLLNVDYWKVLFVSLIGKAAN